MRPLSDEQRPDGRWVPATILPEPLGVRWERMMRHRRALGQGRARALLGGLRDVRAVDRIEASS